MAEPLSQQEIERMLRGLTNRYAARREADAKAFAKVTESNEEIVMALETLATTDPDPSVREAAKFALSQQAHQEILRRITERRKEEAAKRQAEQARFASLQAAASQTEISAVVVCPNCSYQNPRGIKFCQNCGTSLTINCRRCGTPNPFGVVFCGNCGTKLSEATLGIPADEVTSWREAFGAIEWIEELGPRTKQLLRQLESPLDTSKEPILFLTYGTASNRIQDVMLDGAKFRRGYIGVIGTNWRLIFADTDKMKIHTFPYEDIASVEKPEGGGLMKEIRYALHTKSGHHIGIVVHLDAPGLVGFVAGFGSPVTAGHVISHKRRAEEVIKLLNLYFTRIVP
jgi:ribosomal protein L40E